MAQKKPAEVSARRSTRRLNSRAAGPGYRTRIRELAAAGMTRVDIAHAIGVRPSEVELTLALPARRGRPLKRPTIKSVAEVRRWRASQRPRTIRAALECIDYLLQLIDAQGKARVAAARRTLVV